jgi:hypothetical protein
MSIFEELKAKLKEEERRAKALMQMLKVVIERRSMSGKRSHHTKYKENQRMLLRPVAPSSRGFSLTLAVFSEVLSTVCLSRTAWLSVQPFK